MIPSVATTATKPEISDVQDFRKLVCHLLPLLLYTMHTIFVEERSQQYNFFSHEIFHLYRHHQTLLFCTMYYTTMYYVLYNTINVKYLKTRSGLQDQVSAGADYNLIDSVLLLYSSLVLIVGSSS